MPSSIHLIFTILALFALTWGLLTAFSSDRPPRKAYSGAALGLVIAVLMFIPELSLLAGLVAIGTPSGLLGYLATILVRGSSWSILFYGGGLLLSLVLIYLGGGLRANRAPRRTRKT